jgi:magnesium-transporting ATPase (P-type)
LLPFTVSLGLGLFIVFERIFGRIAGLAVGAASVVLAGFFWFGLAWLIGQKRNWNMSEQSGPTPLATKIEQMLTEARVIIPGCQALLGFQFVVMLTHGFDELPAGAKTVHAAALCLVTVAMILLMTPAALHRQSFGGNDSESFLRLGSVFVIAASLPLALGIAADVYVVFLKVTRSATITAATSLALLLAMLLLWYLYPIWLRARRT